MTIVNALRIFYTLTFLLAGVAHFAKPELFLPAMPPYLPFQLELVYLTGAIELLFLPLFWMEPLQRKAYLAAAFYLLALLPAHIHVSVNVVPMFGITEAWLLWLRTFLQLPLIYGFWFLSRAVSKG